MGKFTDDEFTPKAKTTEPEVTALTTEPSAATVPAETSATSNEAAPEAKPV